MIPAEIDTRAFRDALGAFPTGVTVVTTLAPDGSFAGLTVSSFNSVSLAPPLIVWSLSLDSPNLAAFRGCGRYVVNVLAQNQDWLSQRFAQANSDKFAGLDFELGLGGVPLLPGCCAWFECRSEARHPGGDHEIFIGLVERFAHAARAPLVFHRGQYRRLA
jgi:flavin reductase (DIM6/NTAB) family NADH-FMN oxidoreductase RutF